MASRLRGLRSRAYARLTDHRLVDVIHSNRPIPPAAAGVATRTSPRCSPRESRSCLRSHARQRPEREQRRSELILGQLRGRRLESPPVRGELSADDVIRRCEVPGRSGLLVLGAGDSRLTLYSQQTRALNVAWAVSERFPGARVAVVGGGIGGVAIATGLLLHNMPVLMIERERRELHLYADAHHRYVHPRVLEWPEYESLVPDARLPLFDWYAGSASRVTSRWLGEWSVVKRHFYSQLDLVTQATDLSVDTAAGKYSLHWSTPLRSWDSGEVDVVVMCLGYGTDRPVGGFQLLNRSYWDPDALDRPFDHKDVLVSGTGDGGLTDLFRVALIDFKVNRYLAEVVDPHLTPNVLDQIRSIERSGKGDQAAFFDKLHLKAIVDDLQERRRADTAPALNCSQPTPFAPGASALNRLILSQLRHTKPSIRFLPGRLDNPQITEGRITVSIRNKRETFDSLVIRHGPTSPLAADFPEIADAAEPIRVAAVRLQGSDPLRQQQWPDDYFSYAGYGHTLAEDIRRAVTPIQPPDLGPPYSPGEDLFIEYDDAYVRIPASAAALMTYSAEGELRHWKYAPLTRRRLVSRSMFKEGIPEYSPT